MIRERTLSHADALLTASWLLTVFQMREAQQAREIAVAGSLESFEAVQRDLARLLLRLHPELAVNIPAKYKPTEAP